MNERMYTVARFSGLDESADGLAELKMGAASKVQNFTITDGGNLTTRPGFRELGLLGSTVSNRADRIHAFWCGWLGDRVYAILAYELEGKLKFAYYIKDGLTFLQQTPTEPVTDITADTSTVVKLIPFGGKVYIMVGSTYLSVSCPDGVLTVEAEVPYVPLVITGADQNGGGTELEPINMLSPQRRVRYSADGESTEYVLPKEATEIISVTTDSGILAATLGTTADGDPCAVIEGAPEKGVNNLEIVYGTEQSITDEATRRIDRMPRWEAYNGATDTRVFFYGDGTNITYYSDVTESGAPSPLYVPSTNEICVDFSGSPITGMLRVYNKLFVTKPDGTFTITYEPVTLAGGNVVAGFYLRTVNKTVGNVAPGQLQLVANCPRSVMPGSLYEWKVYASSWNDERYSKLISSRVRKTLAAANAENIITADDNTTQTYYMFLGDSDGTILVNRYEQDVWTMYKTPLAVGVKAAMLCDTDLCFLTDTGVFVLDPYSRFDVALGATEEAPVRYPIEAVWESGYEGFGADYRRKFSSWLWVSIKPENYSEVTITAATDKKSTYPEKNIVSEIFNYGAIDYCNWSYTASGSIRTKRLRLKVKKVTYYKLIIRVDKPGARATVLGYDQLVRYTSYTK